MITGEEFRRLRLSRGVSQIAIAKEIGKTKQMVSAYENNVDLPSEETYDLMIKALYKLKAKN